MANSTHTDPHDLQDPTSRAARAASFRPPRLADTDPASLIVRTPESRRASFRPNEDVARRLDAARGLLGSIEADLSMRCATPALARTWQLAEVDAHAAMERYDAAALALHRLTETHPGSPDVWRAARRVWRKLEDTDAVASTLARSADVEPVDTAPFAALELAQMQWEGGAPGELTGLACDGLGELAGSAAFWRAQLSADAHLASGDLVAATERVAELLESVSLPDDVARACLITLALWLNSDGQTERAFEMLRDVVMEGKIADDVRSTLASVGFELDARDALVGALDDARDVPLRLVAARLHESQEGQRAAANGLLMAALERDEVDPTSLRAHHDLLERLRGAQGADADAVSDALIQVLNLRLEHDLGADERVYVLLRLGELYERSAGLDRAAAEVYREALTLAPEHAVVLRALGRVYARRGDWHLLANLYEHELERISDADEAWRQRFRVAEIYDQRLDEPERALAHYEVVLTTRPHYLPALKSCARLMERLGQWSALADLFLSLVPGARSNRQRLYMLDKVAEIAEQRLQNLDVAAGAWEEILNLVPEHPTAFAALGRLYSRLGQWERLTALNSREMELVEDDEERAGLLLRNAEIFRERLHDDAAAERCYAAALELIPDYLPALEGMGRILATQQRWDDLVRMSRREFHSLARPGEQLRHLSSLAQLLEVQLDRPREAVLVLREILERDPADAHAYFSLARLLARHGEWAELVALLDDRLSRVTDEVERAALLADLAALHEWRLGDATAAFDLYLKALEEQPQDAHALDGVCRLWARAERDPHALAVTLGKLVTRDLPREARERFRLACARLVERATGMAEAAAHMRAGADARNVEHRVMLRLSHAILDDRAGLVGLRRDAPLHAWEHMTAIPRTDLRERDLSAVRPLCGALDEPARAFMLSELELHAAAHHPDAGSVGVDIARLLGGGELDDADDLDAPRLRLRALSARAHNDPVALADFTRREIAAADHTPIAVRRLVELARHTPASSTALLEEAASLAVPEILEGRDEEVGASSPTVPITRGLDGPVVEELYDAMFDLGAYQLLRRCLDAHTQRFELSTLRRAYLLDMFSDLLERYCSDLEGAFDARLLAYDITGEDEHLTSLARLARELERWPEAIEFEAGLYERASLAQPLEDVLAMGRALAALMLEHGSEHDRARAIALLEELDSRVAHASLDDDVRAEVLLQLAHAHADHGDPQAAASLFKASLEVLPVTGHVPAWRAMVALWRDALADVESAYRFQWTLVHHDPTCEDALCVVVDLAEEAQALDSCASELTRLGRERAGRDRIRLLWRAAMIYDEYLSWFDRALELYTELLDEDVDEDDRLRLERRRAFCLGRLGGRQRDALDAFRALATKDPFDLATFRGLSSLLDDLHTYDRKRVVEQIRRTLGDDLPTEPLRSKHVPSRDLDDGALELILPAPLRGGVLGALGAASSLAYRVWDRELPQRKALDHNRQAAREFASTASLIDDTFEALGMRRPKTWIGDGGPAVAEVLLDGAPLVWLDADALERFDEPELRFLAGYCAALAWAECSPFLHLDGREVWHLLEAVLLRQTQRGFSERVDARTQELSELISSPLHAVARRRCFQALEPARDALADAHCESWSGALQQLACRLGLAICGDVEASIRCLLKLDGWSGELGDAASQRALRRHPLVRQLFQFALSEDFLAARYALGLAGRPSAL
jgi:tetratricopeptide (TPR) repeat protein